MKPSVTIRTQTAACSKISVLRLNARGFEEQRLVGASRLNHWLVGHPIENAGGTVCHRINKSR
jgi:hypothetical protein